MADLDGSAGTEATLEFPAIPDWVRKFTLHFNGITVSAVNNILIQLKDSAWVTTGYESSSSALGGSVVTISSTAGIPVRVNGTTHTFFGPITFTKGAGNDWYAAGSFARGDTAAKVVSDGQITLSGALTQFRINANGGNFNGGSIGARYER